MFTSAAAASGGEEPICVAVRINLPQISVRQDEAGLSLLTSCHLITLPCGGWLVPNAERLRYQGPPVSLFASRGVSVPSARLGSTCVRPCTCVIVHRGCRVVEEGVKGGWGGSLLAGRPGQLLSRCLRQPQGQSGLSGKNLGWSDIRAGMQEWKEHKKNKIKA